MTDNYNGFKVGDIITTHHPGYHQITELAEYQGYMIGGINQTTYYLAKYKMVLDSKGNPLTRRKAEQQCNINCCRYAVDSIKDEIVEIEKKRDKLLKFMEKIQQTENS